MRAPISTLLDRKGTDVATVPLDATVAEAAARLTERRIGALVASDDGQLVAGVISERDIVRHVAEHGPAVLERPVRDVMTVEVVTCTRATPIEDLFTVITERRIRHVPVMEDGRLVGIVSIGDLVKWRMEELAEESQQLQDYVTGSY